MVEVVMMQDISKYSSANAHVGERYENVFLDGVQLDGGLFRDCEFFNVEFGNSYDVVFEKCTIEFCSFDTVEFMGCTFDLCVIEGCKFREASLDDTHFVSCKMPDLRMGSCSLFGSSFRHTDLVNAEITDSDARFSTFENVDFSGASLDGSDFSDADMFSAWGLSHSQLISANGNINSVLPDKVDYPESWLEVMEIISNPSKIEVPPQVEAPLRVIWKGQRLVSDPRPERGGGGPDAAVVYIFRSVRQNVRQLIDVCRTNHPIISHVREISTILDRGLYGINPVGVGYNAEMIRIQIMNCRDELDNEVYSRLEAVLAGSLLLASQYESWRKVAANRDVAESSLSQINRVVDALTKLSLNVRKASDTFDRRIADSIETQAGDLSRASGNERVQVSVANSSSNLMSGIASRASKAVGGAGKVAGEELLKKEMDAFLGENNEIIKRLIEWAPGALSWLEHFL